MQKHKEKNVAFDAKVNPKKFWNYVGSKMKVKPGIPQLHTKNSDHGSSVTSNDCEKAEALIIFLVCLLLSLMGMLHYPLTSMLALLLILWLLLKN